jgi:hypothetical protein
MHGSTGHIGNCKSRALASKPLEANEFFLSFFLSFFISKMPCKAKASIYATYQLSFSLFTKCASSLHWSEHVYWVSALQLPISFPFPSLSFHLLQVGWP